MAYLKDLISNAQIVGERDSEVERKKILINFIKSQSKKRTDEFIQNSGQDAELVRIELNQIAIKQ